MGYIKKKNIQIQKDGGTGRSDSSLNKEDITRDF